MARSLFLVAAIILAPNAHADESAPITAAPVAALPGQTVQIPIQPAIVGKDPRVAVYPNDVSGTQLAMLQGVGGGMVVQFSAAKQGRYFVVFASHADNTILHSTPVIVGGDGPSPSPGPGPRPDPSPPGPGPAPPAPPSPPAPGKYNLAPFVFEQTMKLTPSARQKAPAVAGVFRGVAAAINAGTLRTGNQIADETRKGVTQAYGTEAAAWKPVDTSVQQALAKLAAEKRIRSAAELAEAYDEIALGLEAVR